ncbi:MAG: SRPBCC family protein [Caldilineaceae bacterium]|nr:SRPBCC family protein [Caldilineaceae bacterium]
MYFELEVTIDRSPAEVFAFLRDKDRYRQKPGSAVLILELLTPEPPGLGSQYREVVRMLPFVRGEIRSQITRFEPPRWLDEEFSGAGMHGHLSYEFIPTGSGTRLVQRESLETVRVIRLFTPLVRRTLLPRLEQRLQSIRSELEAGYQVTLQR